MQSSSMTSAYEITLVAKIKDSNQTQFPDLECKWKILNLITTEV